LTHVDTGAMYRAVTLQALKEKCDLEDSEHLGGLAAKSIIKFKESAAGPQKVFLNDIDVTVDIRTPEVSRHVSLVSSHKSVRRVMARLQRVMASRGGVVLEGRDIGSVILPCAEIKIFLVASIEERARRRQLEFEENGIDKPLTEIKEDIAKRDNLDSSREMSPLKKPIGSMTIDTTDLSIEEQVQAVISHARHTSEKLELLQAGKNTLRRRFIFRFAQGLIRSFFRAIWGVKIIREINLDLNENYIFACNHISYMDPPLIGSFLPREIHFLAKTELFKNKLFSRLIRSFNAVPIKRDSFDRGAMKSVLSLLTRGDSLMLFPEGTRSMGNDLGKPKNGVGYLALNSSISVVPVYVQGSKVNLVAALFRKPRLVVAVGKPIRLSDPAIENCKKQFRL